jgi:hypothetical protein
MSVNLVLKTTDINSSNDNNDYYNKIVTSNVGVVSNNRSSFRWRNINLKILLGDLYEKYERFQIALIYANGSEIGPEYTSNKDNLSYQIKMAGLPFINSYDQKKGLNTITVVSGCLVIGNTQWESRYTIPQYFTFTKQTMINIDIDMHTIKNDKKPVIANVNTMLGHSLFSFSIIPVEEFRNEDITIHRADIKTKSFLK